MVSESATEKHAARVRHRATAPEAKIERRAAILDAAVGLLREAPLGVFSVDALARRAGLAKGTVYLYFGTREEVLLSVHAERAQNLFDVLERALAPPKADTARIARAVVRHLREHPEFLPLAATCRSMLETNISVETAIAFKCAVGGRLLQLGVRVEQLYPRLERGQGVALLMASYGLMLGLWQIAEPPKCLEEAMLLPEMRVFKLDFDTQLTNALVNLWEGATRRAAQKARQK
ncbi:MAG: TetR family transcriptional regulator [Burkholderiales bacterium]|nr:TetR family transcriptional regulator [Burkholderiales bacterium]